MNILNQLRRERWQKCLYLFFLGIYLILAIDALSLGITTWDERGDFNGVKAQVSHALKLVTTGSSNYTDIPFNLEYYGIAFNILPYILGHAYRPGPETYYFLSHLLLIIAFAFLSYVVVLLARSLQIKTHWMAGIFVLLTPSLVGHSFTNTKDIPFALFYTVYTYTLVRRLHKPSMQGDAMSVLAMSLLINLKALMLAPLVLTESVLLLFCWRDRIQNLSLRSMFFSLFHAGAIFVSSVMLSLLLQPAAWFISPIQYFSEAFTTFSSHIWSGCMRWDGSCISYLDPKWSSSKYLYKWLSIKIPIFMLLSVFALFISLISSRRAFRKRSLRLQIRLWIFPLMQLMLLPLLAILGSSNLYGADRHVLFIYPILCLLSAQGVFLLSSISKPRLAFGCSSIIALFLVLAILDGITLHPYQIAYFNEIARLPQASFGIKSVRFSFKPHDHLSTSTEFWGSSTKELLLKYKSAKMLGGDAVETLQDSSHNPPFEQALNDIGGSYSERSKVRLILLNGDHPNWWSEYGDCLSSVSVSRKQFFSRPVLMSKLYECPAHVKP